MLVGDPAQEAGDFGVRAQGVRAGEITRQRGVGQGNVNGAVADRMDRRGLATAATFRNGVMPLDPASERTPAQEAGRSLAYCTLPSGIAPCGGIAPPMSMPPIAPMPGCGGTIEISETSNSTTALPGMRPP